MHVPPIEDVRRELSQEDKMFEGDISHYLSVGASAIRIMRSAQELAGTVPPQKILDFGAGAGRVTRWMLATFPAAEIHACDVRDEDMLFLRETFRTKARVISPDLDLRMITDRYHLIWVGSVITHLPETGTRRLVHQLAQRLEPGGLLVVTFHGQRAIELGDSGSVNYIHDDAWQKIRAEYFSTGYGYADYKDQIGYGISVCQAPWILSLFNEMPHSRLVLLSAGAWDNHHDVVAIQKTI
jgi:SAM-dependent methyltransferase